ncbi:hypothetical protein [Adhaeribacter rhizoryzae]|uniref:Uncharacterized protein n=1 Tax=Adhaeribacter rhizoryzae TaxID=2607907 RepID=A0A5M6DHL6_9BACT|nr:hypothetical protein [Adhaeribacter rhizoryzae]KAA5545762.1 hypothetical protein F0145_12585 [Adhaeribacter rhizoryzae]
MIDGLAFICWGLLCLYTAFFTKNKYAFMWFFPSHGFKFKNPEKGNKVLNVIGGILFIGIGLMLIGQARNT